MLGIGLAILWGYGYRHPALSGRNKCPIVVSKRAGEAEYTGSLCPERL